MAAAIRTPTPSNLAFNASLECIIIGTNFEVFKEMGIVIIVHFKPADHQPLAVIAPAVLCSASPSRHCVPNVDAALNEAERGVYIRIACLRHLRPWC